jgi:hypothetical protein
MNRIVVTVALFLLVISSSTYSQSQPNSQTADQFARTLSEAYAAKTMAALDADHPYVGKVKIIIEHSLADDNAKGRFVVKQFRTLAQFERWLKGREVEDGMPARESRPLKRCGKGVCTFDFDGGILHNHLYLKKISYGIRSGRYYIRTMYLLDGD